MTTSKGNTLNLSAKELVSGDRNLMKALLKEALQEALDGEMSQFLNAAPHERTEGRSGCSADYYHRGLVTRISKLELRVPRDRSGEFSTALLERCARSEKALVILLDQQSRVQVTAILEPRLVVFDTSSPASPGARWVPRTQTRCAAFELDTYIASAAIRRRRIKAPQLLELWGF